MLNDAGSDGNDLFDELEHMGKKVGKQLAEEKVDEEAHQHAPANTRRGATNECN